MARVTRKISPDYNYGCLYMFCEGCEYKLRKYDDAGKLVSYSCPARFSPYDEKCPKKERFAELEAQKSGRTYARPTQVVSNESPDQ